MQGPIAALRLLWQPLLKAAILGGGFCLAARGAEFLVTRTDDAGAGTLRDALQKANLSPGEDFIHFQTAAGATFRIELASPLPIITDPVRIEAPAASFSVPRQVELSGSGAGPNASGLHFAVGNCTVKGLAIGGFDAHGIFIEFFGQHTIQGNFLGTDAEGSAAPNGQAGVAVFESGGNKLGGTNAADGNLISGNGTGVFITGSGARSNQVAGNVIGPDLSGETPLGNSQNGVLIYDANANVVGGSTAGARNLISGNAQSGVYIYGDSVSNVVQGNYIGTDIRGTQPLPNTFDGVTIYGAPSNLIGASTPAGANLISGNGQRGVHITGEGAMRNAVEGNRIGTDASGTNDLGNGFSGVTIAGVSSNRVAGNLISANKQSGILLRGPGTVQNAISGNYIGTDASGTIALRNYYNGISLLESASSNTIGGAIQGSGNVISGNTESGVYIAEESTANLLEGNLIGADAAGRHSISNGFAGVRLEFGGNQVGRAGGRPNVISGNGHAGVEAFGDLSSSNRIENNIIGPDIDAALGLGNSGGIAISGANGNVISGNVISGNDDSGIFLVDSGTSGTVVQGNWIGAARNGADSLGNNGDGVSIFEASGNLIGGTNTLAGNIISANLQDGIFIRGAGASNNVVQRNLIGTRADGLSPLGNRLHGIEIDEEASWNLIGGPDGPNRIAYSQTADFDGVRVHSGSGNTVRCNVIFGNPGLAVDIGEGGVTTNDVLDADTGANGLQNFPVLASAAATNTLKILGELNSRTNELFTIDFYFSAAPGESGYGEATVWLGSIEIRTDPAGRGPFEFIRPAAGFESGFVSAAATDAAGNSSELAQSIPISEPDADADGMPDAYEAAHGFNPRNPSDASADPDRDGLTNLEEYLAGTNPADRASAFRLEARAGGTGTVLEFQTAQGRHYRIEYADGVSSLWRTLAEVNGNGARASYVDNNMAGRARFYRVLLAR